MKSQWGSSDDIPAAPGVYALMIQVAHDLPLVIGRRDACTLPASCYVYIGSAHGSGGLAARLHRHLRRGKVRHWHIDHLTEAAPTTVACFAVRPHQAECEWVRRLRRVAGTSVPIPGFGSSDCREGCPAHLLRLPDGFSLEQVRAALVDPG